MGIWGEKILDFEASKIRCRISNKIYSVDVKSILALAFLPLMGQ